MITPSSSPCAVLKGVELLILDAQTVDETKSVVVCPGQGVKNHTITLRSSASITGAAVVETANDPNYTGVWNPLSGSPIDLSTIGPTAAGELQLFYSNIVVTALRVRISTVVAGGTLSASYLGS